MIYAPSPILFIIFAAALIACAIACAAAKSDRSSVFFMAGAMISAAGLVFLLDIPFTAEITIATAGISGLVMLIASRCQPDATASAPQPAPIKVNISAAFVSLLLFAILTGAILDSNFIDTTQILALGPQTYINAETISSTKEMGVRLISTYIYPFILATLLIMAAILSIITVLDPQKKTADSSAEPDEYSQVPADVPAEESNEKHAEAAETETSEEPAQLPASTPAEKLAEAPDLMPAEAPGNPVTELEGAEK